jgi:hypothetical protein
MTKWRVVAHLGSSGGGWTESLNRNLHTIRKLIWTSMTLSRPCGTQFGKRVVLTRTLYRLRYCSGRSRLFRRDRLLLRRRLLLWRRRLLLLRWILRRPLLGGAHSLQLLEQLLWRLYPWCGGRRASSRRNLRWRRRNLSVRLFIGRLIDSCRRRGWWR